MGFKALYLNLQLQYVPLLSNSIIPNNNTIFFTKLNNSHAYLCKAHFMQLKTGNQIRSNMQFMRSGNKYGYSQELLSLLPDGGIVIEKSGT